MKGSQVLGLVIAIALIVFGISYPVPEKDLYVSSYGYDYSWLDNRGSEYVGGDAYNYQMEASLKAGYVSGVLAMKTVSFVGGMLLFFLSLFSHAKCTCIEAQTLLLKELSKKTETQIQILAELSVKTEAQSQFLQKTFTSEKTVSPNSVQTNTTVEKKSVSAQGCNEESSKNKNVESTPLQSSPPAIEKETEKPKRRFRPTVDADGNWTCTNCGHKNDPDVPFCVECMKDR